MTKTPLYIELLTHINKTQQEEEWVDLASFYRTKLADESFYAEFKEELSFLAENNDIELQQNFNQNPDKDAVIAQARITDIGFDYLRSYRFIKEDAKEKYSSNQIILLMLGIVAATALVAFLLAHFFG